MSRQLSVVAVAALLCGTAVAEQPEPIRISARIGDRTASIEVRDLPPEQATLAIRQALGTLAAVRESLSSEIAASRVAAINRAAGHGFQPVDSGTAELLERALGFCVWSQGAEGPLGGSLYDLWESAARPPAGAPLETAVASADCRNLRREDGRWALADGSRLDLRHFADGHAVDRAFSELTTAGAGNAWIEYGGIVRASGAGPGGHGWQFVPPLFPGMVDGLEPVWLRDRALAVASSQRDRWRFGNLSYAAFLDQRSGQPAEGVLAVLAASELAVDAQALASAMLVLGNREGQFRLGTVDPAPSVLWVLGDGSGPPLITTMRWSALRR